MASSTTTAGYNGGSGGLAPEVKALYDGDFYMAGQANVYWDQFADLKTVMDGQRGITYNFPIVESNAPSTAPLDEFTDITTSPIRANEIVITLQEFGGGVEVTKFVVATSYVDVLKQAAMVNGFHMAESFDFIARAVAGQGSRVHYQGAQTARSGLNKATAAHRITAAFIEKLSVLARMGKMPLYDDNTVVMNLHPHVYYDLLQLSDIRNLGLYQKPEILLNGEEAYWGGVRFIVNQNAKAFWGAGAADASAVSTTLSTAAAVGAETIAVADATNITVGDYLNIIDAAEPGNTWSDTNELFFVTGVSGTDITGYAIDPGPGDNGGLKYAHASGKAVTNASAVYPLVVLGPNSISKAASSFTGPYGESIVTNPTDKLQRFLTLGWYAIVGYTRTRNQWLMRGEVASSLA